MANESYNKTLGLVRRLLTLGVVIGLVILSQPTLWSVAFGFVLTALGEAIRFWSAGHLLKTQELVTAGPYRYSRNPLYLGRLLIFTGLAIMVNLPYYGSWIALGLGWGIFFLYYLPRKERVEPARLRGIHGEPYEEYFEAVPALFPRLTPWQGATQRPWVRERMLRNREQWMVIGLLAATAVLLWKALS